MFVYIWKDATGTPFYVGLGSTLGRANPKSKQHRNKGCLQKLLEVGALNRFILIIISVLNFIRIQIMIANHLEQISPRHPSGLADDNARLTILATIAMIAISASIPNIYVIMIITTMFIATIIIILMIHTSAITAITTVKL